MRHGQTNYNRLGLCNDDPGQDVHLTPDGIRQAQAAADALRHTPLDAIVVSALPRTRQTADIVNQYHRLAVQTEPRLNDIRSGFEGRPVQDYFDAVGADRLCRRAPGGESLLDYRARVLPALHDLAARPWRSVLLVVHEETMRVIVADRRGLSDRAMLDLNFGNCEVVPLQL